MNTHDTHQKGFFYGWWIVLSAVVAMLVSQGPVLVFTFGIFMKPITTEFAWSRSQVSFALTIAILSAAAIIPLLGRLIDRKGVRQVALPALFLFGAGVSSLALLPNNLMIFYLWFCVVGLLSAGATPTPYARAINCWFIRKRGLALGLSMAGIGIGAALMPMLAQKLIMLFGWRSAYLLIGVVIMLGALVISLRLRNRPADLGLFPDNIRVESHRTGRGEEAGYTARQALSSKTFWVISFSFFLAALAINGCSVHFVPMLTDRGVDPADAAKIASAIGVALMVGRVGAGYLLDYVFAPYLTILFFLGPVVGLFLLYAGAVDGQAVLCAVLIGLGVGAEVDLIGYLTARYFGIRSFGEINGYLFGMFSVGTALGPLTMGIGQAYLGSYNSVLLFFAGCMIVACLLMLCVGRYPDFTRSETLEQLLPKGSQKVMV